MQDRRDRERALERLLPQALAEASGASQPGCLDAETLAAWTTGTLRASDAAQVEAHLADCAHCQAVLGTFVRTAPPAAAPDSLWMRWHLRWVVPLATAATALSLYLLLPGGELDRAPETTISMADARRDAPSAAAPAPQPERRESAVAPAPTPPIEADRPSPSRPAPAPPASVGGIASLERRSAASADAAAPTEAARTREAEDRVAVMAQAKPAPKVESKQESQTLMEKASEPAPAAPARPAAVAAPAPAAPPAPAPPAAPTAGARAQVAGERRAEAAFAVRRQVGLDVDIPSPATTHRYRIMAGQRVERTTTGGRIWEPVTRAIAGEMTAGSAPAIDVCWIVGPIGAVWRTTDGQVLVRVPFPEPLDLIRVSAESATAATVTATDGRTFRTDDGGKTWR